MAGKFERKMMADVDLDDPFFDSLKADYPGNEHIRGFVDWFCQKAREKALVFEDEQGVGAFIKLKPGEVEEIKLQDGSSLPPVERLKISTIKIDERYRNSRIGEGAIGLTLWEWRDIGANEIYVTVFEKRSTIDSCAFL